MRLQSASLFLEPLPSPVTCGDSYHDSEDFKYKLGLRSLLQEFPRRGGSGLRRILSKFFLPVENMVYANQQAYYDAITSSTQAGQSGPFIDFMLNEIYKTLKEHQGEPLQEMVPNKVPNNLLISHPELSDSVWEVYALIKRMPSMTTNEMGLTLGISDRMVRKYIAMLRKIGLLERVGSNKNGYWKIKTEL